MIKLRAVTSDNMHAITELEVKTDQELYIETTNIKSLTEAYTMTVEGVPVQALRYLFR